MRHDGPGRTYESDWARPDEKMGSERGPGERYTGPWVGATRRSDKRQAGRRRRRRDGQVIREQEADGRE